MHVGILQNSCQPVCTVQSKQKLTAHRGHSARCKCICQLDEVGALRSCTADSQSGRSQDTLLLSRQASLSTFTGCMCHSMAASLPDAAFVSRPDSDASPKPTHLKLFRWMNDICSAGHVRQYCRQHQDIYNNSLRLGSGQGNDASPGACAASATRAGAFGAYASPGYRPWPVKDSCSISDPHQEKEFCKQSPCVFDRMPPGCSIWGVCLSRIQALAYDRLLQHR